MNATIIQPRPTMYRGILFKSKAEARLALLMDHQEMPWQYEPEFLRLDDGYVPDFVFTKIERRVDHGLSMVMCSFEYKPRRPTESYIEELKRRMILCREIAVTWPWPGGFINTIRTGGMILCGGMGYEQAEYRCVLHGDDGWIKGWPGPFPGDVDGANASLKGYRFDLA